MYLDELLTLNPHQPMYTVNLNDYFFYQNQLVKCEWINTGSKSIGFTVKKKITCPHCEKEIEITDSMDIIEASPNFQENVRPVQTITKI
jgi:hypothetical protein